ncbi:UNVERIFIED_CONTAM: NADP-dependent malic enzyme [Sesamum radiatum]|uniref:Malic enzyme n=1 Tax=Sesamum radiatum TaxID=300843 RepID=A0AAW2MJ07_SESRA
MESTFKELSGESVLDLKDKTGIGGGVQDVYGEDRASQDQPITPWTVSVASGYSLLRDPRHNKGLAFTDKERDAHYLTGLLPPVVLSQELQEKRLMHNLRQYEVPLHRYIAMMALQERNEKLFYKLLMDNVEELLPVVYTPTVGEACQKGKVLEVLKNWPEKSIQVIVVTDGERILGLGDLGCQGMGIPVGKLSLYTALGGVRPSACLPITIDVGTNNKKLLEDEFYIGLKQNRATGQEYAQLLEEFMSAVKQNYGEKVLVQFEDFANHNAFDLLAKYRTTHLVFNDDIQGTASVVLAGLVSALKLMGGTLADHTFLFLVLERLAWIYISVHPCLSFFSELTSTFGFFKAGTGIAELIALQISKELNLLDIQRGSACFTINSILLKLLHQLYTLAFVDQCSFGIWLVDSKGLIVCSRKGALQHFKVPWAHEHEPVKELLDAVKKPLILALSNPTSQSECTAEEAYTWSEGRAIFASGSPFQPVEYNGNVFVPGQANNAYIFPGFGLGLIMSGTVRVHDDLLLAASEALANQATEENYAKGLIYPPFTNIRKISANIAATVAARAYELGLASRLPRPKDLVNFAESCMYTPVYRSYR